MTLYGTLVHAFREKLCTAIVWYAECGAQAHLWCMVCAGARKRLDHCGWYCSRKVILLPSNSSTFPSLQYNVREYLDSLEEQVTAYIRENGIVSAVTCAQKFGLPFYYMLEVISCMKIRMLPTMPVYNTNFIVAWQNCLSKSICEISATPKHYHDYWLRRNVKRKDK